MDDGALIDLTEFVSLLNEDQVFVLRHYSLGSIEKPVFCTHSKVLVGILEDVDQLSNYEYSCIFDKKFTWCVFLTDSTWACDGLTQPIMKIVYPIAVL